MSETVRGKSKAIIMDKSTSPSNSITLGTDLNYDANNAQLAADAINLEFGTKITSADILSFQTIGEVADYVAGLVGG